MAKIRAPYALLACDQHDLSLPECGIICAIDTLVQRIKRAELSDISGLQEFVGMHVEAAEKYYSDFTAEDMFKLDMFNAMASAVAEELMGSK